MNWFLPTLGIAFTLVAGIVSLALGVDAGWVALLLAALLATALACQQLLARGRVKAGSARDAREPALPHARVETRDGRPLGDIREHAEGMRSRENVARHVRERRTRAARR